MNTDEDFSAFASARWAALVRSGVVLGCDLDAAQDLAQTTLLRCYTAWGKVHKADNRDGYVYRMLLNCHRDSRRRRWWGEQPTEVLPHASRNATGSDFATDIDVADALSRALGDLSQVNREVVVLRHLAQMSEQQTAEVLGIAPGTVKSRLSRALSQLATNQHLSDFDGRPAR